jgi:mRNA-degrading endonuclease toxin of MazEF toxin-antitoxin module
VAGLTREGVASCHQVTTLDRAKLLRLLGSLPVAVLAAVEEGVRVALNLP